jgi:hypothetical protein
LTIFFLSWNFFPLFFQIVKEHIKVRMIANRAKEGCRAVPFEDDQRIVM